MKEYLDKLLIENSYQKIPSNLSEITLYVSFMRSSVQAIQVMDFQNKALFTKEQYELIKKRAYEFLKKSGYENVHLLILILTPNVQEAKKFVLDDRFCWIIDTTSSRLVIFENQKDDFYGLRKLLESACMSGAAPGQMTEQKMEHENILQSMSKLDKQPLSERKGFFARNFALINIAIILANVIVFIYLSMIGSTLDLEFMLKYGVMYVPYVLENQEYYRFFTCMFLHFGFQHLAGNMVVLFFLGDNVERAVGKLKYLIIYVGSGLFGSVGSFLFAYLFNQNIVSAGASGAIFGIIGALLWIVIKNRGRLEDMTTFRVSLLIFYALYSGITSENIDNAAHIAGLFGGFLLAVILYERKQMNEN